jgi:hypothetical protein
VDRKSLLILVLVDVFVLSVSTPCKFSHEAACFGVCARCCFEEKRDFVHYVTKSLFRGVKMWDEIHLLDSETSCLSSLPLTSSYAFDSFS